MNVKENQKYQATHQAIMRALMDALKEKNIKQVTVAQVCRTVQINRSTFYEHFLDIYDVLDKIMDAVCAEMLKRKAPEGVPTREDIIFLLQHIQNNKEFYMLFFNQNLPLNIYERAFLGKQPPFPPHDILEARKIRNVAQLEYHQVFFRAGLDAVLKKWLERDCEESPEEIYELLAAEYHII